MASPKTRRRLETHTGAESGNARGCLIWGGVLGIVVGAAFAFYGLKPILKHFYGETTVAPASTYTGGGRELAVTGVTASATDPSCTPARTDPANIVCIAFHVQSEHDWDGLEVNDFSLEVANQHDWLPATALVTASGGAPQVTANTPVTLSIHFPAAIGGDAIDPEYLHLTSPRLRFALDE